MSSYALTLYVFFQEQDFSRLVGDLADQELSCTAGLLRLSRSQNKAQSQGKKAKAKQKREGYEQVEQGSKGPREERSLIPTLLQPLPLTASQ